MSFWNKLIGHKVILTVGRDKPEIRIYLIKRKTYLHAWLESF